MIVPEYARYEFCIKKACSFLKEFDVIEYPIDLLSIIAKNKWGIIAYSELARLNNCTINDVCISLGSKDGLTIFDGYNYTISYNDSIHLGKRRIFTLLHEVGHIYLHHLTDFENTKLYRGSLTKSEYKVLENETNAFTRNVLAPAIIINNMRYNDTYNVSKYFGISEDAAKARLDFLNIDTKIINRIGMIDRMYAFYFRFKNKKRCNKCNYFFISKDANYCPICGNKELKWRKSEMKYSSIELNEFHKAIKCPVCGNKNILPEGEYCHICGTHLVNRCTNQGCEQLAIGNARYCIYCGYITTFRINGILTDWHEENEIIDDFTNSIHDSENDTYFLETDEELPFD